MRVPVGCTQPPGGADRPSTTRPQVRGGRRRPWGLPGVLSRRHPSIPATRRRRGARDGRHSRRLRSVHGAGLRGHGRGAGAPVVGRAEGSAAVPAARGARREHRHVRQHRRAGQRGESGVWYPAERAACATGLRCRVIRYNALRIAALQASEALVGRPFDDAAVGVLASVPGADLCGERGEVHTMVVHWPGLYAGRVDMQGFAPRTDESGKYLYYAPAAIAAG